MLVAHLLHQRLWIDQADGIAIVEDSLLSFPQEHVAVDHGSIVAAVFQYHLIVPKQDPTVDVANHIEGPLGPRLMLGHFEPRLYDRNLA